MLIYDRRKLGAFLKQKRVEAGFTQAQAAQALGYGSPQFLSNIERGVSVTPLPTLRKLGELYHIKVGALIDILLEGSREHLMKAFSRRTQKK